MSDAFSNKQTYCDSFCHLFFFLLRLRNEGVQGGAWLPFESTAEALRWPTRWPCSGFCFYEWCQHLFSAVPLVYMKQCHSINKKHFVTKMARIKLQCWPAWRRWCCPASTVQDVLSISSFLALYTLLASPFVWGSCFLCETHQGRISCPLSMPRKVTRSGNVKWNTKPDCLVLLLELLLNKALF